MKTTKKYLFGTWRYLNTWNPKVIVDADGCYFTDMDGKQYLDFSAQLVCCNLGHKNKRVQEALREQGEKLFYVAPGFATEPATKLAELLAEVAPGDLCKSYFSLGGAEANEAAMKIARFYTGAPKLIARFRSYHGATSGAITLTGDPRRLYVPEAPGVVHAPDCYCYRCPFGLEYPGCGIRCAEYVREIITMEGPGNVAALFVEPIVGSNGVLVPTDEYMPKLREICDETETLLVADEVMTAFGRTGKWFGVENWNVVPDMMTLAKGISGAHIPLSATIVRKKIADFFDEDNLFCHGQTYANHPYSCAAGVAAIQEYKDRNLIDYAAKMGKILGKRLTELQDTHPSVGEVRGKGLFWGIEPVKNRETREPFVTRAQKFQPSVIGKMASEAMKKGVYIYANINTIVITPPLIITEEQIDEGVNVLDEVLKISDAEMN